MRTRDILRIWGQTMYYIGRDKYSEVEWQEHFKHFSKCIQTPTEPYVVIENVSNVQKCDNYINNALIINLGSAFVMEFVFSWSLCVKTFFKA